MTHDPVRFGAFVRWAVVTWMVVLPLCPYPAYAHYRGEGDPENACSFDCRVPEEEK